MTSAIIVKCEPNLDLYVVWNRVSDGIEFVGNRLALANYLSHDPDIKERINRADLQGTSIRSTPDTWRYGPPDGHWTDTGFVYEQLGWLPRDRMTFVAQAILANEDETVYLTPFDDDVYV